MGVSSRRVLDHLVAYSVELLAADAAGILLADARGALHGSSGMPQRGHWAPLLPGCRSARAGKGGSENG
jgi:hypothetical protein